MMGNNTLPTLPGYAGKRIDLKRGNEKNDALRNKAHPTRADIHIETNYFSLSMRKSYSFIYDYFWEDSILPFVDNQKLG
jgi:hypothetical protein